MGARDLRQTTLAPNAFLIGERVTALSLLFYLLTIPGVIHNIDIGKKFSVVMIS
jgi:hypothetical protein